MSNPKYKVLCLHGIGANSDVRSLPPSPSPSQRRMIIVGIIWLTVLDHCITDIRGSDWYDYPPPPKGCVFFGPHVHPYYVAALRYQLGEEFGFEFIDGAFPWPAAPGIKEAFGDEQARMCCSYFDGSAEGAVAAVHDLAGYLMESGPFDLVIGFSLGAALTATLLLSMGSSSSPPNAPVQVASHIRSALFICGIVPSDWDELQRGNITSIRPNDIRKEGLINIPTVHAWSRQDIEYPGHSEQLAQICMPENRFEVLHGAGHSVPTAEPDVLAMVAAVKLAMSQVRFD